MKANTVLITIISLILVFHTQANAQDYVPLAVDGSHWFVVKLVHANPTPFDALWEYHAQGDTMVEGKAYLKIYRRELELNEDFVPPFYPATAYELAGLLREESDERKVYAILLSEQSAYYSGCPIGEESLLFDFSLSVGGTAFFCALIQEAEVTAIEEVTLWGLETREFEAFTWTEEHFLEGIGSGFGLFELMVTPVKSQGNRSVYSTGLIYYCRETPCDFVVSTQELRETAALIISPNPATTEAWLQLPENTPLAQAQIELYSPTGRLVYKAQPTSQFHKIEAAHLPKGLYLIRLWDGERWYAEKLFVR